MAVLKGMLQIKNYAQRSESTVLDWWRTLGFPMEKIGTSSVWESDTDLVDEWRKAQINGRKMVDRPEIKKTVRRGKRLTKKKK